MKKTKKLFTGIFMLLTLTFSSNFYAQGNGNADGGHQGETGNNITDGPGSEGGNCGHGPNAHAGNAQCPGSGTNIPLDGGLSILLLGAAAFGIKKLRQK